MIYLQLFFEFFKAGLFAIGGGLATIPFLTDIGQRTGWFTSGELANMIAISESTPGPMGVNMATYVGFHTGGIAGGVIATLGLVAPSIIVILIIARFLQKFRRDPMMLHGWIHRQINDMQTLILMQLIRPAGIQIILTLHKIPKCL